MESDNHEPTIIGFLCNWCAYQGEMTEQVRALGPLQWWENVREA